MSQQKKEPTTPKKRVTRKAYTRPQVRTDRPNEKEVLAASTGCGNGFDESLGCDFAG